MYTTHINMQSLRARTLKIKYMIKKYKNYVPCCVYTIDMEEMYVFNMIYAWEYVTCTLHGTEIFKFLSRLPTKRKNVSVQL